MCSVAWLNVKRSCAAARLFLLLCCVGPHCDSVLAAATAVTTANVTTGLAGPSAATLRAAPPRQLPGLEAGLRTLFRLDKAAAGRLSTEVQRLQQFDVARTWWDTRIQLGRDKRYDTHRMSAFVALGSKSISAVQQQVEGLEGTELMDKLHEIDSLNSRRLRREFPAAVTDYLQRGITLLVRVEAIFAVETVNGQVVQCDLDDKVLLRQPKAWQPESQHNVQEALAVLVLAVVRSTLAAVANSEVVAGLELMTVQEETLSAANSSTSVYLGIHEVVNLMGGVIV